MVHESPISCAAFCFAEGIGADQNNLQEKQGKLRLKRGRIGVWCRPEEEGGKVFIKAFDQVSFSQYLNL